MQHERVEGFFPDAKSHGYGFGAGIDTIEQSKGHFIKPAIIDNPPSDSPVVVEEPFSPIVPCQPYPNLAEVIKRANDSTMGLGAILSDLILPSARKSLNRLSLDQYGSTRAPDSPLEAISAC